MSRRNQQWMYGLGRLGLVGLTLSGCWGSSSPTADVDEGPSTDAWEAMLADTDAQDAAEGPLDATKLRPASTVVADADAAPHQVSYYFDKNVFPSDLIGNDAPEGLSMVVEPPVPGKAVVLSSREVRFTPEVGFAPGQAYTVRLASIPTTDGVLQAPDGGWKHTFTAPDLTFIKLLPSRLDTRRGQVELQLLFSGPVDLGTVQASTIITKDGRVMPVNRWTVDPDHNNRIVALLGGNTLSSKGTFKVAVRDGYRSKVMPALKGDGGEGSWYFDPNGPSIDVKAVHLVEGTNRFSIEVICDDQAIEGRDRWIWLDHISESFRVSQRCVPTDESAERLIQTSPSVPTRVVQTRGGFRIEGEFPRGNLQVTLLPGLTSIDGAVLKEGKTYDLTVNPLQPTVAFATSGRYLPRDAWTSLPVQHRNLDKVDVTIRHIPERNLLFWLTGDDESVTSRVADVVFKGSVPVRGTADQRSTSWIDVASLLPKPGKGVYEVELKGGGARASARLLLTDLNLVAKASGVDGDNTLMVWALGMEDGAQQAGVEITAVRPSGKVLATCTTGVSGCSFKLPENPDDDDRAVAIIARRGDDLTYLKFDELQTDISEYQVQGESYSSDRPYRASLWTERGVFRPGETAHVAGIIRDKDHVSPPKGMPVDVEIYDPRAKLVRTLATKANDAGMFEVDVPFADYARTGSWKVRAKAGSRLLGEVAFSVEEFVPERMEVEASIAGAAYKATDAVPVETNARYLFGGSAADHRYELSCRLVPTAFKPKNNPGYTYGEPMGSARNVELGRVSGELGEGGVGTMACPTVDNATGFTGTANLVADVAVFEAGSGRTTTDTVKVPVHGSDRYVGLQVGADKLKGGEPFLVKGLVVDWDGLPVTAAGKVTVRLYALESEWGYLWDEDDGSERWQRLMRDKPLGEEVVAVDKGAFSLSMTPPEDGERFRLVAEVNGARTVIEVDGTQDYWWWDEGEQQRDATPRPLKPGAVALDVPDSIEVGKRTQVQFTAPYKGRALVTLETDKVLRSEWMAVNAGPQDWSFTLGEFADNVYVSVMVVKDPHLESEQAFLPDRAFGVASIDVTPSAYTGTVKLGVPQEIRSGSPLTVDVDLGPGKGPRYVTVAAVDEGVLSLTDFETPDPFDDLFPTRALGIRTWETIGWALHLQAHGASKSTGGDGEDGGSMPGRVQMVKPVSLWSGLVAVPESGKTQVSFDVPRYRGKLRVMAVSGGKDKVATAEAHVVVRDPIVVQTTVPRFLMQGDRAEIPVFLTNSSGKTRDVTVQLDANALEIVGAELAESGLDPIKFEGGKQARIRIPDGESRTVVFRVRTHLAAGGLHVEIVAKADDIEVSEGFDIPVEAGGPRERRSTLVALDTGRVDLTPSLSGWQPGTERSTVWITNNPYGQAFSHLSYVVRYPYGCIEQTTSSTRPLLYVGNLLETTDPDLVAKGKIEDMVQHGVDRLMNMQTPSGGFAYWMGGSEPTAWGTAYATHMLLDAREAGFAVPEKNLNDAITWLDGVVTSNEDGRDPYHGGSSPGGAAYMHYVVARAGKGHTARMQQLLTELGTPSEGSEKEAAYLLKAGLYLAGDRRYEADLRKPDISPVTSERKNDWTFYSDQRRRGFVLSVYADLFGADGAEALGRVVADGLKAKGHSRDYTTQEITWGITGLGKILTKGSRDYEVALAAGSRTLKPDTWGAGGAADELTWSLVRASEVGPLTVDVKKKGAGKLYAMVNSEGVREGASWTFGGDGLAVRREYLNLDGDPINLDNIEVGDVVYAKVMLANTSNDRVQNIALVDRFPAGWEIENPRLGRGGGADWIDVDAAWESENLNLRDDRLEVFGALDRRQRVEVVYTLRAVTAGTFTLPPVEAEAMYDPTVWTRAPGGQVTIHGPWDGFYL